MRKENNQDEEYSEKRSERKKVQCRQERGENELVIQENINLKNNKCSLIFGRPWEGNQVDSNRPG
jgi:hypothetical protein